MESNRDSFWEIERRAEVNFRKARVWALGSGLPDPTYDAANGWTLDQFAMRFEPDLLANYKDAAAAWHDPAPFQPLNNSCEETVADAKASQDHPHRWLDLGIELSSNLKVHLLDPRFRVEGYRLGAYEPTVIADRLLEEMQPRIEVSELAETGGREIFRIFEKVRVFDLAHTTNPKAGRKPTYDWPAIRVRLARERPDLHTEAQLVAWVRERVKTASGKSAKDGPDGSTIRGAIAKYGLREFVTPR